MELRGFWNWLVNMHKDGRRFGVLVKNAPTCIWDFDVVEDHLYESGITQSLLNGCIMASQQNQLVVRTIVILLQETMN